MANSYIEDAFMCGFSSAPQNSWAVCLLAPNTSSLEKL